MKNLDVDLIDLVTRRAWEISYCFGINCCLDNRLLCSNNFEELCKLYFFDQNDGLERSYHKFNEICEIALEYSFDGYVQISFVNGHATTRGDKIIQILLTNINQKLKYVNPVNFTDLKICLQIFANFFFYNLQIFVNWVLGVILQLWDCDMQLYSILFLKTSL